MKSAVTFCLVILVTALLSVQLETSTGATEGDSVTIVSTNTDYERFNTVTVDRGEPRRGCCSWHGGVCGCKNGRALCCDGTLSPTCGCD